MRGHCAKQVVTCTITTAAGFSYVARNDCLNAQQTCPRTPGEGYEKCTSVCKQQGHAEIQALAFAKECGADLSDASALLHGHYYVCEPCARALKAAGVKRIEIAL